MSGKGNTVFTEADAEVQFTSSSTRGGPLSPKGRLQSWNGNLILNISTFFLEVHNENNSSVKSNQWL